MKIVHYEDGVWKNEEGITVTVVAGDYIDDAQSDARWSNFIPASLKLEHLPIPVGDMKFRVSARKQEGSNYVHYKGFGNTGHHQKDKKNRK